MTSTEMPNSVKDRIADAGYESVVVFENPSYEAAFIGVSDEERAVYSYEKMVGCLMDEDGMDEMEAREFIDYNTLRALPYYSNGPIIVYDLD